MNKIVVFFISSLFCTQIWAASSSLTGKDKMIQMQLEEEFNISKNDFIRLSKFHDSLDLLMYAAIGKEINKPFNTIISLVEENLKTTKDKKSRAAAIPIAALVLSKESGYSFDEIIKMSDGGDSIKLNSLFKTLYVKEDHFMKTVYELYDKTVKIEYYMSKT